MDIVETLYSFGDFVVNINERMLWKSHFYHTCVTFFIENYTNEIIFVQGIAERRYANVRNIRKSYEGTLAP